MNTTKYLGSLMIDSGRLSLSVGVSYRGWKPGISPFMNKPIIDNIKCKPGLWWVLQNCQGSWMNDHYALVHSDEANDKSKTFFNWAGNIITFETYGKVKVKDTMHSESKIHYCRFNIHPGKYQLLSCIKSTGGCPKTSYSKMDNPSFFLLRPHLPEIFAQSGNRILDIQKDAVSLCCQISK